MKKYNVDNDPFGFAAEAAKDTAADAIRDTADAVADSDDIVAKLMRTFAERKATRLEQLREMRMRRQATRVFGHDDLPE